MSYRKYIGVAIFSVFIILFSSFSNAQSPAISSGLSYLQSSQTSTGYWGDAVEVPYNSFVETCAIANSLRYFSNTDTAYSTAIQWITSTTVNNIDYLLSQLLTLSQAGQDVSSIRAYLLNTKNSDGGWGVGEGITSDIKRTALALQALKASNYSDYSILYQAINFIISNQNSDGGWGFSSGDSSNTYVTAMVLRTLSAYNSVFINQNSINNSAAYLLTKQNADGGFGSSPSNVYETSLSIMSLIESGQGSITVLQNGINHLTSTQLADGSWNDDPYSTALALQALAEVRPNLSVSSSDISFSNPMPQANTAVTITATVHNTGLDTASNVVVRFYNGDPALGGVQIGTDQVIPSLSVNAPAQVSITQSFTTTGAETIFVVVDPDSFISETSKADNKASARLWVATGPDLAVYSADLIPSTYVPTPGTAFTLNYTIRNLGESDAGAFTAALYDGDPNAGGTLLQTANVSGVLGSQVRTGTMGVTLTTNGNHTLYLVADSGNAITETSKTNNTGTVTVNVGGTLTQADLAITPADITLTPSRPHAGDTVNITANVRNIGADAANNFTVEIFDGAPESGGLLIVSQTISLVAGGSQAISANWPIPTGIHDVYVVLDRANQVNESNESNNQALARVMTDMVDIVVTATDIVFTPSHPVNGDSVALSITAHNTGIKDTGSFNLALYNGDPAQGGQLLQTYAVGSIPGDGTTTLIYTFTASPQIYRFYAVADPENKVTELYEDNNLAIRSLKIKAPGETLGPDLAPVKIDLTSMTTDTNTLAVGGKAIVTFQNKGDDKITTSFNVAVFEDMDGDGKYTSGVDNLLGTSTFVTGPTASIPAIWPEGAGMVDVPLSGTVKFLHSPLYAFVDSSDVILEQDETNNVLISCKDCEVVPSNPIQPVVKWRYSGPSYYPNMVGEGIGNTPLIVNLIDTNGDGRVDEQDAPIVLFVTYEVIDQYYRGYGKIHAIRGDTGQEIFTIFDSAHPIYTDSQLTIGDIDNDGYPEIIASGAACTTSYGGCFYVFDHLGKFKWDNSSLINAYLTTNPGKYIAIPQSPYPAVADIDGDGKPEILVSSTAFNGVDGSVKWAGYIASGVWHGCREWPSLVADLDLDGKQEVVCGNTAYKSDGTITWWSTSIPDGITDGRTAIANFDNDSYPEIVLVAGGKVYLLDHNGAIKWGPVILNPLQSTPSTPVIADFDGDGELEIGFQGKGTYFILDRNGYVKNTFSIPLNYWQDGNGTAGSVFDLNGDGRPKVLVNNNGYFRIFDGKTGSQLFQDPFGAATSGLQNVIVSDVDRDGHAEIIASGYNYSALREEIHVYGSANNDWVKARTVWGQSNYHITDINDNGSIPQYEAPSWLLNNTYRTQAAIQLTNNPYLTPNLTASYMRAEQSGSSVNLALRVGNGGAVASPASVTVTFYDGPSTGSGQTLTDAMIIGTASTTRSLNPGQFQDVVLSWSGGSLGLHHIYAVVDAANAISECRKDDNKANVDVTIQTAYADLSIASEDIALPAAPYYDGTPVLITANIRNIGTLSASNVTVRLYNGSPASGGVQVGTDQIIPTINAGGTVPLVFSFDTLGKSGTNVLYVVIDPANAITEVSKTNNTAPVTITVQPAVLPDLAVSASDIQLTPASPTEGDKITVTTTVHNLGTAAGNIPVRVSVRSGEFGVGSEVYSETKTVYPMLNFNTTTTVQTTIDTAGFSGQYEVSVAIDPANTITESRKDNNSASQSIFVQSAGLSSSITLDKATYNAGDVATATITAADTTGVSRFLSLALSVQDSAGNTIATISTADTVTVAPNGSTALSRTWNTGTTLAGNYRFTTELTEGGRIISRASASFSIAPDTRMNAQVTTDKISYNPNETAALTATVTSTSANYIFENLAVTMTIRNPQSTIYNETRAIATLMPGTTFNFKSYWNTGTYQAGAYPVTLEVKDSTGALVTTGTATLTITSVIKPSAALKGTVSVDKQRLLSGETVSISYNVTNVGNVDLSNVTLTVLTDDVVTKTVYDTLSTLTTITMGGSYGSTAPINTTNYTAKDYLVILQATIGSATETLGGAYFRIEGAPSAPSLAGPAAGSDVLTFTPMLSVNNATDPNDDKLTYEFELYGDAAMTNLISAESGVSSQESGVTSWTITTGLIENQTYFWRARAYDSWLYGPWMAPASFRVNTVDDPPTAPTIASPADGTNVATYTPTLIVNNAMDPDSPSLTYNFEIYADAGLTTLITTTSGVSSQESGVTPAFAGAGLTSWTVPLQLSENTWYYWRSQADDWLITGPWSTTASFFVNTTNEPPTTPVITAPVNNATMAVLATDVTISNSTDPDSPVITYFFEVDTVTTFDSTGIIRSGSIAQGQGTTTWHVTGLQEDTQYYVRVKASDGFADSPWSLVTSFFANAVNEPPTAPALVNPSNGGSVTVFTPTLSVYDSTDPDRNVLTYDFEVYADAAMTDIIAAESGVRSQESGGIISWTVPVPLTEDHTYYWRSRAFDGNLYSDWMPSASFLVNTVAEAPTAPTISSPVNGSSVSTLTPTLAVVNATDPDTTSLTYDFEVYSNGTLTATIIGVPQDGSGITSATLSAPLADNTVYQWRSRAYYGQISGPWMDMASFTVHIPKTSINATINFDPDTLNKSSNGAWVVVYIELPQGYNVKDIDVSSIRLGGPALSGVEGTIPAETWPYAIGDYDKDGIPDLMVKFKRSDVINNLPIGDKVTVHVTGKVGATSFEGVDIIRVIQ